jgi:DNA-binding CsgD family transcriptional regulator
MAARIPAARYVELPGDEHLPFVDDQDAILRSIEDFLEARPAAVAPDAVLATVLAIEICDGAQAMARLGNRGWEDVLRSFIALVERHLGQYRGRAVTSGPDRLLAVFDGPSRAIRCAQAIVDEGQTLGIGLRGGLHTGECTLIDDEPGGLPLQTAAWVISLATPGEILLTSTVRDLVSGSGIAFAEATVRASAPPHIAGDWRLFRVESHGRLQITRAAAPARQSARDPLTRREREVVGLLSSGRTNREIADVLVISERTVENHVSNILAKLGLDSRAQVAIWALRGDEDSGPPVPA